MAHLEDEYKGDENWEKFEALFLEFKDAPEVKDIAAKLGGNVGLACVIYKQVGSDGAEWLERKVPALENIRPLDCIDDPVLIKRLRVVLKRMY
ncbi:hypothetical protein [Paraburkholderia sp.]|uniref:hypothetical protein n=1 Tax=Paraburkholderia sp. TaxID=1926495 RepID=UPI003D6DB848